MAKGHGGYRKPSHPAGASGPGALSKRTDTQPKRQLPDAGYGEQAQYQDAQQMPMAGAGAATPTMDPGAFMAQMGGGGGGAPTDVIPFGAPSQNPNQPVTSGAPLGPGPGPSSLGLPDSAYDFQRQDLRSVANALPMLEYLANLPGSAPSTRAAVRMMKSILAGRG